MASFTAGGSSDQCMNSKGVSSSMVVTKAGVNCADVSYVEGKDSTTGLDNCAIKDSVWTLSYSTNSTGDSGSTQSVWQSGWLTNNKVTLQAYTKGTNVCSSKALCSQNIIRWSPGTTGPLYVSSWKKEILESLRLTIKINSLCSTLLVLQPSFWLTRRAILVCWRQIRSLSPRRANLR